MSVLFKKIKTPLIWIFTILVFYWLFKKNWIEASLFETIVTHLSYFLGATLIFIICHLLANYRWILLMRSQSEDLPFWKLVRFHWVGLFFNIALPGAVSGDIVKALLVSKSMKSSHAISGSKTLSTIAVDRLLGVSGMLICSMSAFVFGFFQDNRPDLVTRHFKTLGWFVGIPTLGLIFFFIWIIWIGKHRDFLHLLFEKINGNLLRLYEGFLELGKKPSLLLSGLVLSTLIHVLGVSGIWIFIRMLDAEIPLDISSLAFIAPLGFLATAIPILPGGVGTGHIAFRALLGWIGISVGASVFSCYFFVQCLVGVMGGLVFALNARDVSEKIDPALAASPSSAENL